MADDTSPWDMAAALQTPALPSVDHLSNRASANLSLERVLAGFVSHLTVDQRFVDLYINLVRLTDKALREYDASCVLAAQAVRPDDEMPLPKILRFLIIGDLATDHMENCVDALHRALLYARTLRRKIKGVRQSDWPDGRLVKRLKAIRDAIEHADAKILKESKHKDFQGFDSSEPHTLELGQSSMTIGGLAAVTYMELVQLLETCHRLIELLREVPTGEPSEAFPNYRTRTEMVNAVMANPTPTFTATVVRRDNQSN